MKQYKSEIIIDGLSYTCEVIKGVRFINGMTVTDFLDYIKSNSATMNRLAQIGTQAIKDEAEGRNDEFHNYQGQLTAHEFIEDDGK